MFPTWLHSSSIPCHHCGCTGGRTELRDGVSPEEPRAPKHSGNVSRRRTSPWRALRDYRFVVPQCDKVIVRPLQDLQRIAVSIVLHAHSRVVWVVTPFFAERLRAARAHSSSMWPTSSLADGRGGKQLVGLALVLAAVRDADQPTGFFRLACIFARSGNHPALYSSASAFSSV